MIKTLTAFSALLVGLTVVSPVSAQKSKQNNASVSKTEVKFLDNIEVDMAPVAPADKTASVAFADVRNNIPQKDTAASFVNSFIESASNLQLKYAIMLNTEVEQVQNKKLFSNIDDWYGTPYQYGGSSKGGVDCSAFVQSVYASCYGIMLPRTAHEQYDYCVRVSQPELMEGDLVFFNTLGGVSHVGIYLQNNKFVHASTSGGVMISDLQEAYWAKRFIGAGRIGVDNPIVNNPPTDTAFVVPKP